MRCSIHSTVARPSAQQSKMLRLGDILLACLLAIAGFSDYTCATSPINSEDPFIVIPPGSRPDSNGIQVPRNLGERKFVRNFAKVRCSLADEIAESPTYLPSRYTRLSGPSSISRYSQRCRAHGYIRWWSHERERATRTAHASRIDQNPASEGSTTLYNR